MTAKDAGFLFLDAFGLLLFALAMLALVSLTGCGARLAVAPTVGAQATVECALPDPPVVASTLPSKCMAVKDGDGYCCLYLASTDMKGVVCGIAMCLTVEKADTCPTNWKVTATQCSKVTDK